MCGNQFMTCNDPNKRIIQEYVLNLDEKEIDVVL